MDCPEPTSLDSETGLQKLLCAQVPFVHLVAVLYLRCCIVPSCDLQCSSGASPEALKCACRSKHQCFGTFGLQISISHLDRCGSSVVKDTKAQRSQAHVEQDHSQDKRAVVVLCGVGELEELVSHRHVAALSHTHFVLRFITILAFLFRCKHCLDEHVLVAHEVSNLLGNTKDRSAVEVPDDFLRGVMRVVTVSCHDVRGSLLFGRHHGLLLLWSCRTWLRSFASLGFGLSFGLALRLALWCNR